MTPQSRGYGVAPQSRRYGVTPQSRGYGVCPQRRGYGVYPAVKLHCSGKEIIRYTKWLVIFDISLWDCPHITSPGH